MMTVSGSTITANDLQTMYRVRFATSTGVATGTNVTNTGSSVGSWRFTSHYGNLAGEMSTQDEGIRERLKRIFRDLEAPIEEVLNEAMAAGDLTQLDSRATAGAMVAYLEGLTLMAKTWNDPEIVRVLGPAMLKLAVPVTRG